MEKKDYLLSLLKKIEKINFILKDKIDLKEVEKAYYFAEKAHKWQFRKTWEPYIIHPVEVAKIVLDLKPETETVVSAILHDVVEDTEYTVEDIKTDFWEVVSEIVYWLTKVSKIDLSKVDKKVWSLRKMFIAMAKDLRVVFIKLSDRYHNLKTIGPLSAEKQKRIANETMDIYIPVAERLGIYKMKTPLEDLCFKILQKKEYLDIKEQVWKLWKGFMNKSESKISNVIKWEGFENFEISWRVKWVYSIYKKMIWKKIDEISEIYDIFAIRVIVDSLEDCYRVLWIVHKYYRPLSHRFKDYISIPKPNWYRSLHTVIIWLWKEFDNEVRPVEVQIRTKEMHFEAEYWAASHWSYKEWLKRNEQWRFIKNLVDLEEEIEDNNEFLRNVHIDVLNKRIFVLTPQWDIRDLPKWATALDFAFAIHSDIWLKCVWANINWKWVALSSVLKNWDTVKINTKSTAKPNPMRLSFVKTTRANTEIKKWLSDQNKDLLLDDWIKLLNDCFEKLWRPRLDKNYSVLKEFDWKKITKTKREEIIEKVWKWVVSSIDVMKKILSDDNFFTRLNKKSWDEKLKKKVADVKSKWIYFKWWGWESYKLMETCCNPQEWDEIIWYIGRGASIWVHKKDCPFIKSADYKRFIKWFWEWWPVEYSADLEIHFSNLANDSWKVFKLFDIDWVTINKIVYNEDLNPKFQVLTVWTNFVNLNNFSILIEKIWELNFVQSILVKDLKS